MIRAGSRSLIIFCICCNATTVGGAGLQIKQLVSPNYINDTATGQQQPEGDGCSMYWYNWDVYTGRDFATNEPLFENSVVQDFVQHSRRPFPTWNRATNTYLHQPRPGIQRFVYAPATVAPLTRCDGRSYNVRVQVNNNNMASSSNENVLSLVVDRKIRAGQPLIRECFYNDKRTEEEKNRPLWDDVPFETLQREGYCLDATSVNAKGAAYAKRDLGMHQSIIMGSVLHMHRQELKNEQNAFYESVIGYCWGHPETNLLLLPLFPIVGNVQHDGERPNLKLQWRHAVAGAPLLDPLLFSTPFSQWKVNEDPWVLPWIEVVTTRAIAAGEPLTLNFGPSWNETSLVERQLPEGFFPDEWLKKETLVSEWPEIATPPLAPGQVEAVRLTTGESLGTYHHRVGLPQHFGSSMAQWAKDLGLFNLLIRYVTDDGSSLSPLGEERNMFNGGQWWSRRFGKGWQSNLHMMSPDDDEATKQMHAALHQAGFDAVLQGVGQHFNLSSLTGYFPCFLVVSHCTVAHIHWDTDYPTMFNLILPLHQVEGDDTPELILADDEQIRHVPYKYEPHAGILLGKDGMHGTAPTDYRDGKGSYRIAMSISMGDFSKDDETVKQFLAVWHDPPYPNYLPGQLRHSLLQRRHWSKNDDSVSMGNLFVPFRDDGKVARTSGRNQFNTSMVQMEVEQYS